MIPITLAFYGEQDVKVTDPHSKFYGLVGTVKHAIVYAEPDITPLVEYVVAFGTSSKQTIGTFSQIDTFIASALEAVG